MEHQIFDIGLAHSWSSNSASSVWACERLSDIATALDNLASSEQVVQLQRLRIRGTLRTYNDGNGGPFKFYILVCRAIADNDPTSDNSFEGVLSAWTGVEFVAYELPQPRLVAATEASGNHFYQVNMSWSPPKRDKRVFRSSEQIVDTPNLLKELVIIHKTNQGSAGPSANIDGTFRGIIDVFYTRHRAKANLFAGPAI